MSQPPKVLLLYAHPESPDSVANRVLLQQAQQLEHVTVHDLYAHYPDFFIDIHREQQLLREHKVIVFQHPLYTYSCPALLKEWMDRVLARGFASGAGAMSYGENTGVRWSPPVNPKGRIKRAGITAIRCPTLCGHLS